MKKHFIVLCLIIYVIIGSYLLHNNSLKSTTTSDQNDTKILYGKIITNNANLLKMSVKTEDPSTVYFLLEESYFVKILNKIDDDFYYVEYKDIKGYVKSQNIMLVNEIIQNPYLNNITFNLSRDCFLYQEPKNINDNQITKLSKNQTINYYGKIFADEIAQNSGDVWYYSSVQTPQGLVYGYIHSSFTHNLSPINPNQEISTQLISQQNEINSILSLNLTTQSIVIIIISFPILLLLFILLKGFKKI